MTTVTAKLDLYVCRMHNYLIQNLVLVMVFISIAIAAYGFELFNLNLTIDEEVHAFSSQADRWIEQGRWGMYLLNRFLLPQSIIPFVPLFIALTFHIVAILLLLSSWRVESNLENLMVGAVGIAYPGMAYMYTFSTINYGIGIGLFFVALSLSVYVRAQGAHKFYAVFPAAVAIAIYQGFAVALAVAFLVLFISTEIQSDRRNLDTRSLLTIAIIGLVSGAIYLLVQKLFLWSTATKIGYVDTFFDINFLRENFGGVGRQVFGTFGRVYLGSPSIYGNQMTMLAVVVIIMLSGLAFNLIYCKLLIQNKLIVALLIVLLLILPFAMGFLMRGHIAMRFLVALPILFSGLVMLGVHTRSRVTSLFTGIPIGLFVFQSIISTNTLFSSSALALQADRLLAGRVLERIADAKATAGATELKYLEIVGYIDRIPTRLIPKLETFGASFFEWDQGNTNRVLLFLRTLGYQELQALPLKDRSEMMELTNSMPIWPEKGSVRLFGNTAVVKFGPYSYVQKRAICEAAMNPKYCD